MSDASNLQDTAYDALRTKILHCDLRPGDRVVLKALQAEFGIGATPIREALLRLRRDGLIAVYPQSGTFVARIHVDALYQARFAREQIEKAVVASVAVTADKAQQATLEALLIHQATSLEARDYAAFFAQDDAFHQHFYALAHKDFVWAWLQSVNLQFNRFRFLRLEEPELDWQQIYSDHVAIVEAVTATQPARAERLVARHLHMVDEDLRVALRNHPDYFD